MDRTKSLFSIKNKIFYNYDSISEIRVNVHGFFPELHSAVGHYRNHPKIHQNCITNNFFIQILSGGNI